MTDEDYKRSDDLYEMAEAWINTKDFEKAIPMLQEVININPNFIYAYITLSEAYKGKKDYQQALIILKKAAAKDPEFDQLYYLMALIMIDIGDLKDAITYLDQAIKLNPSDEYNDLRTELLERS